MRLERNCGTDILVYIELDRFLADMPAFDRAVFIEPIVLYGSRQLEDYAAVKAALRTIPHEVLNMPTNSSGGTQLLVLKDLNSSRTEGALGALVPPGSPGAPGAAAPKAGTRRR